MGKNFRPRYGFTLIELSVVLVVVGVMLSSVLAIGGNQIEAARVRQTEEKLTKIQQALQLFYEVNGRMPCPFTPSLLKSDDVASGPFGFDRPDVLVPNGYHGTDCEGVVGGLAMPSTPAIYLGAVPTRSLGLPDDYMIDAWNNRIIYAISHPCLSTKNWTLPLSAASASTYAVDTPITTSPYGCVLEGVKSATDQGGIIEIRDLSGNVLSSNAVYVLISYGKNGLGATPDFGGDRFKTANDTSSFERVNARLTAGGVDEYDTRKYFYEGPRADYIGANPYFDDIVRWKTGPQMAYDKDN